MPPHILTVTLNPAIDRMVRYDRSGAPVFLLAGGKGINVARAAEALGLRVKALTVMGGASGCLLAELLHQEQLPYASMTVRGRTRVNTTKVYKNGEVDRSFGVGPIMTVKERSALMGLVACEASGCRAVVFAGSLPPGYPLAAFLRLVGSLRHSGALVAVDTRGQALRAVLRTGSADIIKPNRQEAEEVLGFELSSDARIRKALRVLAGYGIKKVLISLGKDGLAAFDGRREVLYRTPVIGGGHTVGCGDAALAGFLAAQIEGRGFEVSVAAAAACGAANVLADVPGGINKKEVRSLSIGRESLWS